MFLLLLSVVLALLVFVTQSNWNSLRTTAVAFSSRSIRQSVFLSTAPDLLSIIQTAVHREALMAGQVSYSLYVRKWE